MENENKKGHYDCFISYRRSTGFFLAKMIKDSLEKKGVTCFLDLEESRQGRFNARLISAIQNSSNFILLLTDDCIDRCTDREDWVRREIETAMDLDLNFIPVRTSTFQWPDYLNFNLSPQVLEVNDLEFVPLTTDYFEAAMSKLHSYLEFPNHVETDSLASIPSGNRSVDFFKSSLNSGLPVESVDMAFHAGSYWTRVNQKADLLMWLIDHGIKVRILFNSKESVEPIISHMRHPLKNYVPLDANLLEWKQLQSRFPDSLEVRVAALPLLHRIYLTRLKNGKGSVSVKNYRYGDYSSDDDHWIETHHDPEAFRGYCDEFDYIWYNLSVPVEQMNTPS